MVKINNNLLTLCLHGMVNNTFVYMKKEAIIMIEDLMYYTLFAVI